MQQVYGAGFFTICFTGWNNNVSFFVKATGQRNVETNVATPQREVHSNSYA
jgi:hypothetical protein